MNDEMTIARGPSLPLVLGGGNRVMFPSLDPVFGWVAGSEDQAQPRPLVLPEAWLAPAETARVTYGCHLPAAQRRLAGMELASASLSPKDEDRFLLSTLPGGQTEIFDEDGKRALLKFRWASFGFGPHEAVWRCYWRLSGHVLEWPWREVAPDYVFSGPDGLASVEQARLTLGGNRHIDITHPEGQLLQIPSIAKLVKVVALEADGWGRRLLRDLRLYPGGAIIAAFSDGRRHRIGVAALDLSQLPRAA